MPSYRFEHMPVHGNMDTERRTDAFGKSMFFAKMTQKGSTKKPIILLERFFKEKLNIQPPKMHCLFIFSVAKEKSKGLTFTVTSSQATSIHPLVLVQAQEHEWRAKGEPEVTELTTASRSRPLKIHSILNIEPPQGSLRVPDLKKLTFCSFLAPHH